MRLWRTAKQPQDPVQVTPWGLKVTENSASLLLSRKWTWQLVMPVVLQRFWSYNSDYLWNALKPSYEIYCLCCTLMVLANCLSEKQFVFFVQSRWNPCTLRIWALKKIKGSENILWDLTWSKSDYKFIIHLGDFADFLSSLSGLWTACNFIVNVRLMLDECFKQNLWCLRSIYLTHWNVFILCFMVYITNSSIYIPFPDRLTIYLLN